MLLRDFSRDIPPRGCTIQSGTHLLKYLIPPWNLYETKYSVCDKIEHIFMQMTRHTMVMYYTLNRGKKWWKKKGVAHDYQRTISLILPDSYRIKEKLLSKWDNSLELEKDSYKDENTVLQKSMVKIHMGDYYSFTRDMTSTLKRILKLF